MTHLGIHSELRAVYHFLEQADELGIPTPLDYAALQKHQAILVGLSEEMSKVIDEAKAGTESTESLSETVKQPFPLPEILPGIALAQHHRVPTRLLDWTEFPLVAAYFAAAGCVSGLRESGAPPPDAEVAVYILETFDFHRESARVRLAMAPRYANTHLRAQRGIFVYCPLRISIF